MDNRQDSDWLVACCNNAIASTACIGIYTSGTWVVTIIIIIRALLTFSWDILQFSPFDIHET